MRTSAHPRLFAILLALAVVAGSGVRAEIKVPRATTADTAREGDGRVALVVGVGKYRLAPELKNPINDARLIAATLRGLGFDVTELADPDTDAFEGALRGFAKRIQTARVALMFYSGSNVQIAGHSYLLPTGADPQSDASLRDDALDVASIVQAMDAPGRINLLFLDTCFGNPVALPAVAPSTASAGGDATAARSGGRDMLIAFAAQPDALAMDGEGGNSPFTASLARHLPDSDVEIRQMLTRVSADVRAATKGAQVPWSQAALGRDFFFVPPVEPRAEPAPARP